MAGDWIKMRIDLGDDPAVISMADATEKNEDEIVGKLHRLWSWADRHATDGFAIGITRRWVDRYVSISGFSVAMESVKWLEFEESGVRFPNFDRHNGKSAKTRCDAAIRQRLSRKERDRGVTGGERVLIPSPFFTAVLQRDQFRCAYCGSESSLERESGKKSLLSVDHIIPVTRGGRSSMDNLLTACKLCNGEKNDRTPEEWGILPEFLAEGVTYVSQKICDTNVTKPLPEKRREEKNNKRMAKPSVDEILEYGKTLDPPFRKADTFIAFYESNGWLVGKNPMKDWKAAVRTWQQKDKATTPTKHRPINEEFSYQKNGTSQHRPLWD